MVTITSLILAIFLILQDQIIPALATSSSFPAILVFGDSLVDTGNNNFIPTLFRANHAPYGRDFPGGEPTGRFSNGRLMVDFLAEHLKIKDTVPPALQPELDENDLRTGVNFASAGSGYDDITSAGSVIPFSRQMEHLENYVSKLKQVAGDEAQNVLNNALVVISCGSNDFGLSYFGGVRKVEFTLGGYQDFLLRKLEGFLKTMHEMGLRKIAVMGLPAGGCLPVISSIIRTCVEPTNAAAQVYNQKLKSMLSKLQASLPGSKLAYANIFDTWEDMFNNPHKYGFSVTSRGCCGGYLLVTGPLCNAFTPLCPDANQYMFWDNVHPTEAAYKNMAQALITETLPQLS
uniref:GDSL esterase/lipase n=1 Tax=Kalanchoe fedtschenkoi TaxID=63787 RepID=A0A7N0TYV8_KALFE